MLIYIIFFTVLVSDTYGVSTGSYTYPDGRVVSGSAYPIRAKSGDVYLNAFNPDYLHAYFDIFKLSMNDNSDEAISCCKSIYSGYMGCPNTNSAVALTSKLYPIAYSFDGFSDYYNSLYSDYLVDNGDSGKSVGYEDLNPSDFIESPKIPGDVFNSEIVPTLNNKYSPKNAMGKMSYRTDERWHNMYDGSTTAGGWWYSQLDLYSGNFGFSALGGDDMYMIFFARTDNTDWYGKYQYHLYVTTNDVWYDDRDEIEYTDYTLNYEYWDNIDGSQEQSVKGVLYSGRNHYFDMSLQSNFTVGAYSDIQAYTTGFRFSHKNSGSFSLNGYNTVYSTDLQQFISLPHTHFADSLDFHSTKCSNDGCDVGYLASLSPISTVYNIDTTRIPEDHYITVSGDTIYDYSITNPVTGDTTTISNYITNNYNFPPKDDTDTSGGGTSGNVTVSGKIDVSGTVSVDVNVDVNINGNGGGGGGNSYEMPDTSFFDDYLDDALKESSGIRKFIADFFDSMPGQITELICLGLVLAILCRLIGR